MRFQRRLRILYVVFCVALGVVWLRAGQLGVVDGADWERVAREMRQHSQPLEARRGSIISADGKILAEDAHAFQLALIPYEWQRRGRARCADCGAMYYERGLRVERLYIPKNCSCARHARRGASPGAKRDAYPRTDIPKEGAGVLEKLPNGDVSQLEAALGMEPGEIARLAAKRIKAITAIVDRAEERARAKGDTSIFLETYLKQMREDLLKRRTLISGSVPDDVARLVLTDETGRYRGLRMVGVLKRYYPQGNFAPHLLGWTAKMKDGDEVKRLRDIYGKERITLETRWGRRGLEKAYNAHLHGVPGRQMKQLDKQGRFTRVLDDEPPRPGRNLYLSIDVGVSREAETILEAQANDTSQGVYFPGGMPSAAFVMLDATTGEILLWAETPRFDLNTDLDTLYGKDRIKAVKNPDGLRIWEPRSPLEAAMDIETWRSQVIVPVPLTMSRVGQIAVEPGSTLKPLIGLAMLESGLPLPMEGYHCYKGARGFPGCHGCGNVDLEAAICKSCNRYFAFSLRDSKYWSTYRTFVGGFIDSLGLGQRPTSECSDWVAGRWLWNWYDFPLADAAKRAQTILDERYAPELDEDGKPKAVDGPQRTAPKIQLTLSPRSPASIAGDQSRLAAKFADLADWVAEHAGVDQVQVAVSQEKREGSKVTLRFTVRAAGRTGWFALPGALPLRLPQSIHAMHASTRGVVGDIARGGYAWFDIEFPRHLGRDDPTSPPVIRPDDGRNAAIGQGPVLTTPLHMARAMATLANGGYLVEPHAVRAVATRRTRFERRSLSFDPRHLQRVRTGMWEVVNTPAGTADRAPWGDVPADVYGKTGTAQVGGQWKPWATDDADKGAPWHHWFVGFAEAPGYRTVAFACVLHSRTEAGAGMTAAPATARILARWFASKGAQQRGAGR